MKHRALALVLFIAGYLTTALAMDGISIAAIVNSPSYKQWMSPGKLARYEIKADRVVKVDSLSDINAGSPRINRSGTYYAYIRVPNTSAFFTRTLVIKPLYGNSGASREIPLKSMPSWLWWLPDGSMMYTVYPLQNGQPTRQDEIRKITFGKVGGELVVTDRMWAKVSHNMQGGFIAIDGTGSKLIYTDGNIGGGGFIMNGDSTQPPVRADIQTAGCGYSLSPSGDYFTQWAGGHSATTWNRWDRAPVTPTTVTFTAMIDSGWPVFGPDDPEGKLEVYANGVWRKDPIGLCGADNIWAENSEYWHISEIGAGWLEIDADCYNAIALSWKWRKAINITKIMPVKETMSSRSKFRGITFTGGTQRSADHPTLWCSNQEDVAPELWRYAGTDRDADNRYWSDLLGLPLSQATNVGKSHRIAHDRDRALPRVSKSTSGVLVTLPESGHYRALVRDMAGRTVVSLIGCGSELHLGKVTSGSYSLEASQGKKVYRTRFVVGQ